MRKPLIVPIKSFPKGWYLTWSVSSQCYYNGNVQIKSGGNVLQTIEKTDHSSNLQILGNGSALIPSEDMEIVITFYDGTEDEEILEQHQVNMILNKKGKPVGITIGMCVEDSYDQDFNDLFISLKKKKKRG